jgi:hypothetical protein
MTTSLGSLSALAKKLGLKRTRKPDPVQAEWATQALATLGFRFSNDAAEHVGNRDAAPEPLFGAKGEDTERDHERLREAERRERIRTLARALLDEVSDPSKYVSDDTAASALAHLKLPNESWPDFLDLVRAAAREAGLRDLAGPSVGVGASTANDAAMSIALAHTIAGGSLSDAESEAAADALTGGRYSRDVESSAWEDKLWRALQQSPKDSNAYGPLRSALQSVRQSKAFNRTLSLDEKKQFADAIRHGEEAAAQHANNNAHRLPEGNRTGGSMRTERQRNLR